MIRRAASIALVVGTLLTIINQGDVLLTGQVTPLMAVKIALSYAVPFGVAVYAARASGRERS